jgi:starch-binding outer membrane protein, SusD/RagB family
VDHRARPLGENARGIDIRVSATDARDRSTFHDYEYNIIDIQERAWDDKLYFMPIARDETNRNGLLVQNPGY